GEALPSAWRTSSLPVPVPRDGSEPPRSRPGGTTGGIARLQVRVPSEGAGPTFGEARMDTLVWIIIAVAVIVVLVLAAVAWSNAQRRRHLHARFGSEYDRTVEGADRRREAERDLREREARHDELQLRPLSDASRQRYQQQWMEMQSGFVDR